MAKLLHKLRGSNPNPENQYNIICVEIRVKFRRAKPTAELNKRINFGIEAIRETKQQLQIPENEKIEKKPKMAISTRERMEKG